MWYEHWETRNPGTFNPRATQQASYPYLASLGLVVTSPQTQSASGTSSISSATAPTIASNSARFKHEEEKQSPTLIAQKILEECFGKKYKKLSEALLKTWQKQQSKYDPPSIYRVIHDFALKCFGITQEKVELNMDLGKLAASYLASQKLSGYDAILSENLFRAYKHRYGKDLDLTSIRLHQDQTKR